ncbi:MAG: hypothetical protein ABIJ39_01785 [Chloroflexota bacterium]
MTYTVIVHLPNEDPVVGELAELPKSTDTMVTVNNPRRRDGKDLHYLSVDIVTVIWPVNQITFIEVMPSEAEEQIIGFVRD